MINLHFFVASMILVKYVLFSVHSTPIPPVQLSVPPTRQTVKQLRILHTQECVEVLVGETTLKRELGRQTSETLFSELRVVQLRVAHPVEVKQEYPGVEPGQSMRRGITDTCTVLIVTILPEQATIERRQYATDANDVVVSEQLETVVQFTDIIGEFQIDI